MGKQHPADEQTAREDAALLARIARDADAQALEDFYERHAGAGYALALQFLRTPALAEDALQEALCRVWRFAGRFKPQESATPRAWFLRIVVNESLTLMKKRKRDRPVMSEALLEAPPEVEALAAPARELEHAELVDALRRLVADLPWSERTALSLYYEAGFSQAEIGKTLNMPRTTVSYSMQRAIEQLRAGLAKAGFAASVPLLLKGPLGEALLGGETAPTALKTKLLSSFASQAQHSVRAASATGGSSAGWIAAVVLLGAGAAAWWATAGPAPAPTVALPQGEFAAGTSQPADDVEPAVPNAPLFHKRWTFENGAAGDLPLVHGTWRWQAAEGKLPAGMRMVNTTFFGLPVTLDHPVKVSWRGYILEGRKSSNHGVYFMEGNSRAARTVWRNSVTIAPPRGGIRHDTYIIGRYVIDLFQGKISYVSRLEESVQPTQLVASSSNALLVELEIQALKPDEVPARLRDMDALIKSIGAEPEEVPTLEGKR